MSLARCLARQRENNRKKAKRRNSSLCNGRSKPRWRCEHGQCQRAGAAEGRGQRQRAKGLKFGGQISIQFTGAGEGVRIAERLANANGDVIDVIDVMDAK